MKRIIVLSLLTIFCLEAFGGIDTSISSTRMQASQQEQIAHVVLTQGDKPVCVASAFENSHLVPSVFNITRARSSINLPECKPQDIAQVQEFMQNVAVLTNENETYQTANLGAVAAGGICLASTALVAYLTKKEPNTTKGLPAFQSITVGVSSGVLATAGEHFQSKHLLRAGGYGVVAGVCGMLGSLWGLTFLTEW